MSANKLIGIHCILHCSQKMIYLLWLCKKRMNSKRIGNKIRRHQVKNIAGKMLSC